MKSLKIAKSHPDSAGLYYVADKIPLELWKEPGTIFVLVVVGKASEDV